MVVQIRGKWWEPFIWVFIASMTYIKHSKIMMLYFKENNDDDICWQFCGDQIWIKLQFAEFRLSTIINSII
jgi:hypothetical protein